MNKVLLIVLAVFISFSIGLAWKRATFRTLISDLVFPYQHGFERKRNIMVPMRDGLHLNTQYFTPSKQTGPYPTILVRTTYGAGLSKWSSFFVKNGYAVVVQNVRGRNGSEGNYSPHRYSRVDGYDTIEWIVKQGWSNGKVGTFGCSYLGENQIMLSAAKHPNHIAMITDGAGGAIGKAKDSYNYFGFYENGVLNLASALGWFTAEGDKNGNRTQRPADYALKMQSEITGLPVAQLAQKVVPYATGFNDIVSHSLVDNWWEEEGYIHDRDTFSAATLHVNTWYDQSVHDTFRLAELMAENSKHPRAKEQYVLIDPGNHCEAGILKEGLVRVGEMQFLYKDPDFRKIYLDWFDYWLKGEQRDLPPRFRYFLIHSGSWKTSDRWPPANVQFQNFYLQANGHLDSSIPEPLNSIEKRVFADSYHYDPLNPVPTVGGPICCTNRDSDIAGALDQSGLKSREDVLIFTSNSFDDDVDLIGNVKVSLFVSTTALDTDFTVKIVDQDPNGTAYNLQDGVVRLRYREGIATPKLAEPDTIYPVELELRPIAYRVKQGHKIALYISSSNFPRLARNLNSGENEYTGQKTVIAENSIYRSNRHPSHISLPIASD